MGRLLLVARLLLAARLLRQQPAAAQLPAALLDFRRHEVKDASRRGALCNDGSPAVFYFRDCPRPGAECDANPAGAQWLVVFESATTTSGACFDAETCAALPAARTSSRGRPAVLAAAELATGILSDSGEGNPNFYERRAVFVPSCDGSMWLGNSSGSSGGGSIHFRGRAIMKAVWEDLQTVVFSPTPVPTPYGPGPNNTKFSDATQVAVVGSSGVIRWLDALAESAPAPQSVVGICDGCLLLDLPARVNRPCTPKTFPFCPPKVFLSQVALPAWQTSLPAGAPLSSLFASELLTSVKSNLLVQHPQFDQEQLKALGVTSWPPRSGKDDAYARMFAKSVRSLMRDRPRNGMYTFSLGCSGYASAGDEHKHPNALLDHGAFNCRPVENCTLAGENGTVAQLALTAATSMFLTANDSDPFRPTCIDTCDAPDCSKWCGSQLDCGIRL